MEKKGRTFWERPWHQQGCSWAVRLLLGSSPEVRALLRPAFWPKAGFASAGSAIAYSAYSIPDVMVDTTFHDYYVTLAVLNTIVSTGLSCYSRYLAAVPQRGGRGRSVEGVLGGLGLRPRPASWDQSWAFEGTSHLP